MIKLSRFVIDWNLSITSYFWFINLFFFFYTRGNNSIFKNIYNTNQLLIVKYFRSIEIRIYVEINTIFRNIKRFTYFVVDESQSTMRISHIVEQGRSTNRSSSTLPLDTRHSSISFHPCEFEGGFKLGVSKDTRATLKLISMRKISIFLISRIF